MHICGYIQICIGVMMAVLTPPKIADTTDKMVKMLSDTGSLLYGDYILASGKSSPYYFDSKLLTLDPEGAKVVGEYFFNKIADTGVAAVGGMALGAIPIVNAVALISHLKGHNLPGFYVRKEPKAHGTQNLIEGKFPKAPNAPVAILDDVVTGGGSILQAIKAVEDCRNPITEVMCILDRSEGGKDMLLEHGYELKSMFSVEGRKIKFNP